jgi:acyl carrier protein
MKNEGEELSTFDEVRSIASDILGVPAASLSAASAPATIENWDSVQHLSLVLALEEKFSLQLSPEEIDQMKTLGATAQLIDSKLQASPR